MAMQDTERGPAMEGRVRLSPPALKTIMLTDIKHLLSCHSSVVLLQAEKVFFYLLLYKAMSVHSELNIKLLISTARCPVFI